jgi:hypothetical protein
MAIAKIKIIDRRQKIFKGGPYSGGRLVIRFTGGNASDINKAIKAGFEDQFFSKIDKSIGDLIGTKAFDNGLKSAVRNPVSGRQYFSGRAQSGFGTGDFMNSRSDKKDKLLRIYVKAWNRTYASYITKHKQALSQSKYDEFPFVKWKKENLGNESKYLPGETIKYTTHSLATGFLRRSISQAFSGETNYRFLRLPNLFLVGGFEFNRKMIATEAGSDYFKFITRASNFLNKLGVYSGLQGASSKDFVQFFDNDWQRIADFMVEAWTEGPVSAMEDALKTLQIDV